jgi:hypothetical protein
MRKMEDAKQRDLTSFEEAEKVAAANATWFKPETNISYVLTFKALPNGKPYQLVEKEMPDFNDSTKKVKKVALNLQVESINGDAVSQEWSILTPALIKAMQSACETGAILRKKYKYKSSGEGKQKTHSFSEAGDK